MSALPEVHGTVDPRFTSVRDTLVENFASRGEVGAAVCVTVGGQPVVDLWAGFADQARTRPWTPDTIANVYSTTKGMTAICAHRLIERGELDVDAPVARYWPEFAQAGKGDLPVRYLLNHRAGLPAISRALDAEAVLDWSTMTDALAAQAPWWPPGEKHGYHALTYGWLVGEVIRRVSGKSVGAFFRDEIATPLSADFFIGLPEREEHRVAALIAPPPPSPEELTLFAAILQDSGSMLAKVFTNPPILPDIANTRPWRAAEIPAANGHTSARALARIYGVLACGGSVGGTHILGADTIERAIRTESEGPDAVLPLYTRFGLGFMLSTPEEKMGPNPRSFGHGGMGGSMGFGDLDAKVGFGYVMNAMQAGLYLIDPRAAALIRSVYDSL